jgi:hypothetical protein
VIESYRTGRRHGRTAQVMLGASKIVRVLPLYQRPLAPRSLSVRTRSSNKRKWKLILYFGSISENSKSGVCPLMAENGEGVAQRSVRDLHQPSERTVQFQDQEDRA